ncbi:phosphotransferase [Roseomonas xinghualingensis]|uniref:phosphotransferase n=1 Tax=Roseomonas xinghualingensis TaxID=2986475 RepID=UPI0021F0F879|nr:phosphotransferase [Roseomonas sp. SXEYE001]MCV4208771.1 phosphotransferase [Roseomonas sp. SXEYE001]
MPKSSDLLNDPLTLAPPPSFHPEALRQVLSEQYGLEGRLEPLGGERDRNLRLILADGAVFLVKLAHPDEDPAITDFQTAALLHLEEADAALPVPRMRRTREGATAIPHSAGDGRPCLLRVLTFLPGQPMTEAAGPGRAHDLGGLTARLNRALAGFAHPADTRRLIWDLREAPALRALLPNVAEPVLRDLASAALDRFEAEAAPLLARLPEQVIHNDLNPHNVLVEAGDPTRLAGIIDFGDMVRASRLQEVATTCAYLLRPGPAPLAGPAAFLAGYRAVLPLPEEEAALLPRLIATRMAMTVLITSWRARRQPENATYILRNMPGARAGLEWLTQASPRTLPPHEE